jgi:hypothetical protein
LAAWVLYLRKHSSSGFWRAWLALLLPLQAFTAAGCWSVAEMQQLQLKQYKVGTAAWQSSSRSGRGSGAGSLMSVGTLFVVAAGMHAG